MSTKVSITNDAARSHAEQGMTRKDQDAFLSVARKRGEVIMVRAVSPLATQLLEEGHPTKGFHIKGKSSDWGPQAGFICEDQSLSKLDDQEKVKKLDADVRSCVPQYAVLKQLVITQKRLDSLIKIAALTRPFPLPDGGGWLCVHAASKLHQRDATFLAEPIKGDAQGRLRFYTIPQEHWGKSPNVLKQLIPKQVQPLQVLCSKENELPLTADYDLLMICPRLAHFDNKDRLMNPDVADSVFKARIDRYNASLLRMRQAQGKEKVDPKRIESLERSIKLLEGSKPSEDPELGNVTQRIREVIVDLNKAMGLKEDRKRVHHNADSGSPATDMAANFPATVFQPEPIGDHRWDIGLIQGEEQLRGYLKDLFDAYYYIPKNPLWKLPRNYREIPAGPER